MLLKHRIITIVLPHFLLRQVENKEIALAQVRTTTARLDAASTTQARPPCQCLYRTTSPSTGSEHAARARPIPKARTLLLRRGSGGCGSGCFQHRPGWKMPPTPVPDHFVSAWFGTCSHSQAKPNNCRMLLLRHGFGHCRHRPGWNMPPTPVPDHTATPLNAAPPMWVSRSSSYSSLIFLHFPSLRCSPNRNR